MCIVHLIAWLVFLAQRKFPFSAYQQRDLDLHYFELGRFLSSDAPLWHEDYPLNGHCMMALICEPKVPPVLYAANPANMIPAAIRNLRNNPHLLFVRLPNLLSLLCIIVGVTWLLLLPLNEYSRRTYISENALLPGQVHAYFSGSDQNIFRGYKKELEGLLHDESHPEMTVTPAYAEITGTS